MININDITKFAEELCKDSDGRAQFKIEMRLGKWAVVISETCTEDHNESYGPVFISSIIRNNETVYMLEENEKK